MTEAEALKAAAAAVQDMKAKQLPWCVRGVVPTPTPTPDPRPPPFTLLMGP
jgi:hypothetical protein